MSAPTSAGAHPQRRRSTQEGEDELRYRLNLILDSISDGVLGLDLECRINFCNPAALRLLGYNQEQLVGADPDVLLRRGDEQGEGYERPSPFRQSLESGERTRISDEVFWLASGETMPVEYTCSPLAMARTREGRRGVISGELVVFSDITERRAAEQKLARMARFDNLTGLANRVLFNELLETAMARADRHGHKLALVFCDLDRFKMINDTFGHDAGDGVLIETAKRIRGCVRKIDHPCRLAGDEFAIILDELRDADSVGIVGERLVNSLAQPFEVAGQRMELGGSVGVAVYPDDAGDALGLFRASDQAMYVAKRAGRGRWSRYSAEDEMPAV